MAGRFFEPTEEESERMAAETTNASRADLSAHTKLDKSHSGPALVPRSTQNSQILPQRSEDTFAKTFASFGSKNSRHPDLDPDSLPGPSHHES